MQQKVFTKKILCKDIPYTEYRELICYYLRLKYLRIKQISLIVTYFVSLKNLDG